MSDAAADGTVSSVPTNADAVPSRANSPMPGSSADKASPDGKARSSGSSGEALKTPKAAAGSGGGGGGGASAKSSSKYTTATTKRRPKSSTNYQPHPRPPFPEPGSTLGTAFAEEHPTATPDMAELAAASHKEVGRYFTLGRLGRGTFCSIHKCVDLGYHHTTAGAAGGDGDGESGGDGDAPSGNGSGSRAPNDGTPQKNRRIVAAKVELSSFAN